ncbi:hypothetical protein [Pseudoalteromonas luteoviolacea]|uniref:Lipoprotein n=1 Tax=Pseudoalteromonas luteoviolacea S4060-1 TaxID=1365257 RepID=A0A162CGM2_9GAMM|nr:hypothetical protein [Pseudoalteromonas luteoviolacea]KZN28642.1 hypothetical protein N480_11155 [Pseudoalteromonas luteoviolacea S2607]KZN67600.1 hypothetical protein N478_02255 [Pseudoalteromonas luteoviolacea S4060-1]
MKQLIAASLLAVLVTGCAHHNNVRPAEDGKHYVNLTAETREKAAEEAIDQANHFCEEKGSVRAYVINEQLTYMGSMPEEEYLRNRNLANAVEVAGAGMAIFGRNAVDDVGTAMWIGGGIAEDSMGEPYQINMSFSCK